MTFLAPILLAGLALAAVPVVIHLLNRRRFQRVEWGPMKYLKLTIKTNRRRMRLEQLVLLALRTLVVVVVILAVARPVLSATGLGGWLGARGRTARLLVVDDSLSMGYLAAGRSAFDAAKDVAGQLAKSSAPQDSLTAVVTSAPREPVFRDVRVQDPAKVVESLNRLRLGDAHCDWAGVLKAADDLLAAAAFPRKEVILVTDLRRAGWDAAVTDTADKWAGEGVAVRVIDVGSRETANVSLAEFRQEDPVALPGAPLRLRAAVRNDGPAAVSGAQAVLNTGGGEADARPVALPDLPPGGTPADVPLSVTPRAAGRRPMRLELGAGSGGADPLPGDDVRWLNVTVRPALDLDLVDGEPGARPFEGETDFLALAFGVGAVPWQPRRLTDAEWLSAPPAAADVLVLANVAALPPERVEAVERLVREQGVGLMIFPGEQVDANLYNERLYRDGAGLLPARLEKPVDGSAAGIVVEKLDDSPLEALARLDPSALTRVVARRYLAVEVPPPARSADAPVRVLARWNDPEARPAVIEKRFGRGRVLLWTTTADKAWGDWPVDPTYVLAVRSAAMAIARSDAGQDNFTAGQPIRVAAPAGEEVIEPRVDAPGGEAADAVAIEHPNPSPQPGAAPGPATLRYDRTPRAGVYTLRWKDAAGAERSRAVCVNPDKAESDLRPIGDEELSTLFGEVDPAIVHYAPGGEGVSLAGRGREVWKTLAAALLAMAAIEAVMATWVGRER